MLKNYHVYFSATLDIDFLILKIFGDSYKQLLDMNEDPRFYSETDGERKQQLVIEVEQEESQDALNKRFFIPSIPEIPL